MFSILMYGLTIVTGAQLDALTPQDFRLAQECRDNYIGSVIYDAGYELCYRMDNSTGAMVTEQPSVHVSIDGIKKELHFSPVE